MKKILTLCVIHQHPRVLLGFKKHGFGAGQWNGFGGKVEAGETIEKATARELEEEAGIVSSEISKVGVLEFSFESEPKVLEVHIYRATEFEGEPIESDEMRPQWFHVDEIPFDKMWSDDKYWMPLLLEGKKFTGKFLFDRPSDENYSAKIIKYELSEIEDGL